MNFGELTTLIYQILKLNYLDLSLCKLDNLFIIETTKGIEVSFEYLPLFSIPYNLI
jgi:hypothetical protein